MIRPELQVIRRAFPTAQALLADAPTGASYTVSAGWHDTTAHRETGAAAVARRGGPLEVLVGEIVRVTVLETDRACFVFVAGLADVPADLSLARRAFFEIASLAEERITAVVEPV